MDFDAKIQFVHCVVGFVFAMYVRAYGFYFDRHFVMLDLINKFRKNSSIGYGRLGVEGERGLLQTHT